MPLILASTSPYRRELLQRLRLAFDCVAPHVDEASLADEAPGLLAARLAAAKARAVAADHPEAYVLGSDQVAELHGRVLGKAGDRDGAIAQLTAMSGQVVTFHTAVALVGPAAAGHAIDQTRVRVRRLGRAVVARYVDAEPAFDCAGSFKAEGLGIALFESIEGVDPTALIGLPLIATARLLREAGFALP